MRLSVIHQYRQSPLPVTAGIIDVTVTNPNGTSTTSTADEYTYISVTTATTSPTTAATTAIPVINGTFSINSVPSYANVYIDSTFKGFTPLTLYNITPDTYIVNIQKTVMYPILISST